MIPLFKFRWRNTAPEVVTSLEILDFIFVVVTCCIATLYLLIGFMYFFNTQELLSKNLNIPWKEAGENKLLKQIKISRILI